MKYTDKQLQVALAKMLPEKIKVEWHHFVWREIGEPIVKETEWLHVCWLIETALEYHEANYYTTTLKGEVTHYLPHAVSASWQQRAEALAQVKGVEVV